MQSSPQQMSDEPLLGVMRRQSSEGRGRQRVVVEAEGIDSLTDAGGRGVLSAAESDLDEPLLGYDEGSEAHRTGAAGRRARDSGDERALVPHSINAYDWGDLVRGLVAGAVTSLQSLAATISNCMARWRQPRQRLTITQTARLEALRCRIAVPYDGADPAHQEALRALWAAAFPEEPCPESLKSERWKDMGWQGVDPGTDFRGAGLVSLECHLYMARRHPALFDALRHKRNGTRSQWEYPFGAAGVNLTFMLIEALDLRDGSRLPKTPAGRAFLRILGEEDGKSRPPVADAEAVSPAAAPFEELYCEVFRQLDAHWLAARATYMEFKSVLATTRKDVERALGVSGGSLAGALKALRNS